MAKQLGRKPQSLKDIDKLIKAGCHVPEPVPTPEINLGDRVRSFDFDCRDLTGEQACYIEGTIVGFANIEGCERYAIYVTLRIVHGVEKYRPQLHVYPPKNGIETSMGDVTNYVEKIKS